MRTKTLLLTAALTAAGALTSMAQVYSVNIVGYVNLSVPPGFSLIANQLDNTPDNKISTLFPGATLPTQTIFYKWIPALSSFDNDTWNGTSWSGSATSRFSLDPGEGAFVYNPSATAFTATFVGQVRTGTQTINVLPGFQIVSSIIPQQGNLYDPITANNDLGFGVPEASEIVYQFFNNLTSYDNGTWNAAGTPPAWTGGQAHSGHGPILNVGESFFNYNPTANTHAWTRTFNVGP